MCKRNGFWSSGSFRGKTGFGNETIKSHRLPSLVSTTQCNTKLAQFTSQIKSNCFLIARRSCGSRDVQVSTPTTIYKVEFEEGRSDGTMIAETIVSITQLVETWNAESSVVKKNNWVIKEERNIEWLAPCEVLPSSSTAGTESRNRWHIK